MAVDGKTSRRTFDRQEGKGAIHTVSVWAAQNRLVLGQRTVAEKSNEITAIPELLGLLEIKGCLITLDAEGCQRKIVSQILEQKGDYVIGLKANQPSLFADVELFVKEAWGWLEGGTLGARPEWQYLKTVEKAHGRFDVREYLVCSDIGWLQQSHRWPGLQSVGAVRSLRETPEKSEVEQRLYLCSLPAEVSRFAHAVRTHWQIENGLHWVLDMTFREDENRSRKDNGPKNLVVLRHLALNLLKQETSSKRSLRGRRKDCGWETSVLEKVIFGEPPAVLARA